MGIKPIIRKLEDNPRSLDIFEKQLPLIESEEDSRVLLSYPTVYIHNWNDKEKFEVYVGETSDIITRTRQHYDQINNASSWQQNLKHKDASLYIIGHKHFNKSLTLDIENRLMHYLMSVDKVMKVHNLRGNPQNQYYPVEELDDIFRKIWKGLRNYDHELFPTEAQIRDSAIFKASPLHKLTNDQERAKQIIINKVEQALKNEESGKLIFIDGEAGTGKTVLNSSTFYELYCRAAEKEKQINCVLLVNHEEQVLVYKQIAEKLGINKKDEEIVSRPTTFINHHSIDEKVDVAFVDEAHLLWTQGKQSYRGKNQLQDIMDRARVTVVMFDENQILTTEQYWEMNLLSQYREIAKKEDNYIKLTDQLRMHASPEVIQWIDSFTKDGRILKIPGGSSKYQIRVFDSPEKLDRAIINQAKREETALSRLIATYDWAYNSKKRNEEWLTKYWEVIIGEWHKPWNRELSLDMTKKEKQQISGLAWAEQPKTIGEVGSTFTIQGFDLNYAGVILGPSVKYIDGKIVFDPSASFSKKAVQNRTLSNGQRQRFGEELLKHEVRVLMTRGVNGLYIYACDDELRKALLQAAK